MEFGCTCSAERVEAAMAPYSAGDIAHITTEGGRGTAGRPVPPAPYAFDPGAPGVQASRDPDATAPG